MVIIGSSQAGWVVAEGAFDDVGYKKGGAWVRGVNYSSEIPENHITS